MSQSGARQWHVTCAHLDGRPSETAMHSEVSTNNHEYFPEEDRVTADVDAEQLREWLEQARDNDGPLVVCNQCRRVKIVLGGTTDVLHGGDHD